MSAFTFRSTIAADITARSARIHDALLAAGRPPKAGADFLNMLQGMRRTLRAVVLARASAGAGVDASLSADDDALCSNLGAEPAR